MTKRVRTTKQSGKTGGGKGVAATMPLEKPSISAITPPPPHTSRDPHKGQKQDVFGEQAYAAQASPQSESAGESATGGPPIVHRYSTPKLIQKGLARHANRIEAAIVDGRHTDPNLANAYTNAMRTLAQTKRDFMVDELLRQAREKQAEADAPEDDKWQS